MQNKYRVYAKIIGYILPGRNEVHLHGCVIKKMSLREQKRRKFKAIEAEIKDPGDPRYHKSYITRKSYSDPRFIKTRYVIYYDVGVGDENQALGCASKLFDRVCGSLALTVSSWFNKKHNRTDYKTYEYQLCRVYKLDDSDKESPVNNLQINGGGWSMICYPGVTNFKELDFNLLARILASRNEIFNKAFKYLLQAEQDLYRHVPPQMLTINLFKCIELIVYTFSGRRFNNKLKKAAIELNLTADDLGKIKKLKEARDKGDVAHPSRGSRSDFYPPQFPIPEDVDFPNFWYSGLASKVLLNYFLYVDSLIKIKLSTDPHDEIDEVVSVNYGYRGAHYEIRPSVRGRNKITNFAKRKLSEYFGVPYSRIRLRKYSYPDIVYQIKGHLDFDLNAMRTGRRHKIIIFP